MMPKRQELLGLERPWVQQCDEVLVDRAVWPAAILGHGTPARADGSDQGQLPRPTLPVSTRARSGSAGSRTLKEFVHCPSSLADSQSDRLYLEPVKVEPHRQD